MTRSPKPTRSSCSPAPPSLEDDIQRLTAAREEEQNNKDEEVIRTVLCMHISTVHVQCFVLVLVLQ